MVLALAITVNLILTGPMYSMVTLATGGGKVSEENVASATQLCENIADEGIVLLDNDGTLPMAKNSKLNVFGWASTNPLLRRHWFRCTVRCLSHRHPAGGPEECRL